MHMIAAIMPTLIVRILLLLVLKSVVAAHALCLRLAMILHDEFVYTSIHSDACSYT